MRWLQLLFHFDRATYGKYFFLSLSLFDGRSTTIRLLMKRYLVHSDIASHTDLFIYSGRSAAARS